MYNDEASHDSRRTSLSERNLGVTPLDVRQAKFTTAMPLSQASEMTRSSALEEPAMTTMASTLASIIDWICWICVWALPCASVIIRSFTRPAFFSSSTSAVMVPIARRTSSFRSTSACRRAIVAPLAQSVAASATTVVRPTAETLPSSIACSPSRWQTSCAVSCVILTDGSRPMSCSVARIRSSETRSSDGDCAR